MASEAKQMTPDDLVKHPEYNHLIWNLKPAQKGKIAVAKTRGGPIDIAYEVHGHGNLHLVVCDAFSSYCPKIRGLDL